MKVNSLLSLLLVGMALVACNSGGSSGGGSSSTDVQSDSGTMQVGNDIMTYSLTATGCINIVSGGSCSVTLTYSTNSPTSVYAGPLSLTTQNISTMQATTGFISPDISLCNAVSTATNTCNFSIQATESANVNLAQYALINSGTNPYLIAQFQIGH